MNTIRINLDKTGGRPDWRDAVRSLWCRLFDHDWRYVEDYTKPVERHYKECECCELQVDPWDRTSTKADRYAKKQASTPTLAAA